MIFRKYQLLYNKIYVYIIYLLNITNKYNKYNNNFYILYFNFAFYSYINSIIYSHACNAACNEKSRRRIYAAKKSLQIVL